MSLPFELVGFQMMDFKGESGDRITGAKLFCLGDEVPVGKGLGRSVEAVFASSDKLSKVPPIGSKLDLIYNRFGRLQRVVILD